MNTDPDTYPCDSAYNTFDIAVQIVDKRPRAMDEIRRLERDIQHAAWAFRAAVLKTYLLTTGSAIFLGLCYWAGTV